MTRCGKIVVLGYILNLSKISTISNLSNILTLSNISTISIITKPIKSVDNSQILDNTRIIAAHTSNADTRDHGVCYDNISAPFHPPLLFTQGFWIFLRRHTQLLRWIQLTAISVYIDYPRVKAFHSPQMCDVHIQTWPTKDLSQSSLIKKSQRYEQ